MKTRPCKVSMEGGEPLSPAVGFSEIIYLRSVPRFPSWKNTLLREFCIRRDGRIHCTVNLVKGGGCTQGPRGGRTAPSSWTEMKQWLQRGSEEPPDVQGIARAWGRGRKGVCTVQGQDSALATRMCSDGSCCGGAWLRELGWVRAGPFPETSFPPGWCLLQWWQWFSKGRVSCTLCIFVLAVDLRK